MNYIPEINLIRHDIHIQEHETCITWRAEYTHVHIKIEREEINNLT